MFRRSSNTSRSDDDDKGASVNSAEDDGAPKKGISFSADTRANDASSKPPGKPQWFEGAVVMDLIESINLSPVKKRKTASPCVRIFGPDGLQLGRSKQIPDSLFPKFNDDFAFDISVRFRIIFRLIPFALSCSHGSAQRRTVLSFCLCACYFS